MLIDWFTVVAQAINFLVLVVLLRRFLYRPILDAMAAREKRIASRLADAEAMRRQADERSQALARTKLELESRREQILLETEESARDERLTLLEQARVEVAKRQSEWLGELERNRFRLIDTLTERAHESLVTAVGRTLSDLAGQDLQDRIVDVFLRRLENLDAGEAADLDVLLAAPEVTITSASTVSPDQRQRIREAIDVLGDRTPALDFEVDPALVCGLELGAAGRRISWSFRHAVRELEDTLRRTLEQPAEVFDVSA